MSGSWDQWPQSPEAPALTEQIWSSQHQPAESGPCLTTANLATILHRNNNIANAAKCWSRPNHHWSSISLKSEILPIQPGHSWSSSEGLDYWTSIEMQLKCNGRLTQREQMSCRLVLDMCWQSNRTNRKVFSTSISFVPRPLTDCWQQYFSVSHNVGGGFVIIFWYCFLRHLSLHGLLPNRKQRLETDSLIISTTSLDSCSEEKKNRFSLFFSGCLTRGHSLNPHIWI